MVMMVKRVLILNLSNMIVTVDWIKQNYKRFNKMYFDNKLPDIEFKISRSKNSWGYASFNYIYERKNLKTIKPTAITISNYYDSPENIKQTTLLHEMIHIKDYVCHPEHFVRNGRRVTGHSYDPHGWWFKSECEKLKKFGWEIEKYVTKEEEKSSKLSASTKENLKKKINEAIACVISSDKMTYIIKTDINKISDIKRTIKRTSSIDWEIFLRGKIKTITFYKSKSESFASLRSCMTKLTGKRIMSTLFEKYKNSLKLTEYKI